MFSSLTERGAAVTLEALMLGADDYVPKPTEVSNFGVAQQCICDELLPRIRDLASRADRHSVRTAGQLSTTLPRRHPNVSKLS